MQREGLEPRLDSKRCQIKYDLAAMPRHFQQLGGLAQVSFAASAKGGLVRMSVTRLSKMLHGARMADLVKLQRGTKPAGQRRQWAVRDGLG